ncbi:MULTISPECIES: hypothetical protein [Colwellia]|uniref:Exopolysaccharide biosynthesis protein n=1 Tax=Colwellia marinimaniae TaxID=1513592 RepID=A0ABQ0N0A1_9GAMM|nr:MULTISPECIES: hypothetical protein [Colwellia]GAW98035.1 exopolysaccharide biosynthesis protein [Colwellia marinimaniae]
MKVLLSLVLILLNGCSTTTFNSNAGVYAENSIRKSVVDRYTNEEVWRLGASQIGYVETNYCQVDYRDLTPSTKAFISELKVKTQKLGGNALVFDSCIKAGNASCHKQIQCRGMAYLITYNKQG